MYIAEDLRVELQPSEYDKEKLPQVSKYGIHIAHFWIQSNPESAELVNF